MGVSIQKQAERLGVTVEELGAKGGRNGKGSKKSPYIMDRRNCNSGCPFFPICPAKHISDKRLPGEEDDSKVGKCAVARISKTGRLKNLLESYVLRLENDHRDVLRELWINILLDATKTDTELDDRLKTLKAGIDLDKQLHGENKNIKATVEGDLGLGRMLEIIREEEDGQRGKEE